MQVWNGLLKVTDNRTGEEFLIFSWEIELVDDAFLVEPCNRADFFRLMRSSHGLPQKTPSFRPSPQEVQE